MGQLARTIAKGDGGPRLALVLRLNASEAKSLGCGPSPH